MMRNIQILLLLLLLSSTGLHAQTDEINISAAFTNFIDLRIQGTSSIQWTVATIQDYKEGFWPGSSPITFQVASSTSFSVDMNTSPMTDGQGNSLDLKNLTIFILAREEKATSEKGQKWNFGSGDYDPEGVSGGWAFSEKWWGENVDKTILVPGPAGNAGSYEDNEFTLRIGLGRIEYMQKIGMPSLLDQNITPGTYAGTITLTAIPQAL